MSVPARIPWLMVVAATLIGMITMGGRQVTGLFVAPLNTSTGLGIVTISFAMAIGQFTWGLAQPVFGALADRHGRGDGKGDRQIILDATPAGFSHAGAGVSRLLRAVLVMIGR